MVNHKVDLRIHTSAVTTRGDDDRYRAQAKAYGDFQGRRVDLDEESVPPIPPVSTSLRSSQKQQSNNDDPTIYAADTQQAWRALESSVWTNSLLALSPGDISISSHQGTPRLPQQLSQASLRRSPRNNRQLIQAIAPIPQGSQRSEHSSDSQRTRSSYLRTPELERSAKKRRIDVEDPSRKASKRQAVHSLALPPEQNQLGDVVESKTKNPPWKDSHSFDRTLVEMNESNETTSELPTSYGLSEISSQSSRARNRTPRQSNSGTLRSNSNHISNEAPSKRSVDEGSTTPHKLHTEKHSIQQNTIAQSNTPPGGVELAHELSGEHTTLVPESSKTTIPPTPKTLSTDPDLTTSIRDFASKPFSIIPSSTSQQSPKPPSHKSVSFLLPEPHPPPPSTCSHLPLTHQPPQPKSSLRNHPLSSELITKSLHKLAVHPVNINYKTLPPTREIRDTERGCWVFNPSGKWSVEKQVDFWTGLGAFVRAGNLGWGVWAVREGPLHLGDGSAGVGDREERQEGEGEELGAVRVYCWGLIVKHVWLVLYAASDAKIRNLAPRWVDAEDKVVVRMQGDTAP